MSFWGPIIGSAVGGLFGNSAANQDYKAQQAQIEAQMAGFNLSKPYLEQIYGGASDAYQNMLAQGPYSGQTLAGPNPYATSAYNTMGGYSPALMEGAYNMANNNAGFSNNYQDIYNKAIAGEQIQNAQNYATENSQPLVDAAMRDTRRTLEEQTLPGINRASSGSGNANSSRAGIADANAIRAYDDRASDVSTAINDQLMGRYLSQDNTNTTNAMNATGGMANAYQTGLSALGTAGNYGTAAGNALQGYDQAALDDAQNNYNTNLNFGMDTVGNFNNIMQGKPTGYGNVSANMVNPMSATYGGMMSGYGMGGQLFGNNQSFSTPPWLNNWLTPYSNQNMFGYGV